MNSRWSRASRRPVDYHVIWLGAACHAGRGDAALPDLWLTCRIPAMDRACTWRVPGRPASARAPGGGHIWASTAKSRSRGQRRGSALSAASQRVIRPAHRARPNDGVGRLVGQA